MSNKQSTFRDYCKQLWKDHLRHAGPWARDQIAWALLVTIALPILAALAVHRRIDWQLFWTAVLFFFVAFLLYSLGHFIRAGWKTYKDQETKTEALRKEVDDVNKALEQRMQMWGDEIDQKVALKEQCDTFQLRTQNAEGQIGPIKRELADTYEALAKANAELDCRWPRPYLDVSELAQAVPVRTQFLLTNNGGGVAHKLQIQPLIIHQ